METRANLGASDKAISAYRRLLKRSIDQVKHGEPPVLAVSAEEAARLVGPLTIDGNGNAALRGVSHPVGFARHPPRSSR